MPYGLSRGYESVKPNRAAYWWSQANSRVVSKASVRCRQSADPISTARPVQAAITSALTFAVGAALPLVLVLVAPPAQLVWMVAVASLAFLAALGAVGARAGGASIWRPTARVTFWGALAMVATFGIGALFGTAIA